MRRPLTEFGRLACRVATAAACAAVALAAVPSQSDAEVRPPALAAAAVTERVPLPGTSHSVEVGFTADVVDQRHIAAAYIALLATFPHSDEVEEISVLFADPSEIDALCEADPGTVAACYEPQSMTIIMPAVDPAEDGPVVNESPAFTFAHEYGHHVDARRWGPHPVSLGPMYWSSQQFACLKAERGEAYTGGTGAEYYDDPTEAFADVYATLVFPNVPWEWTDTFRPDQAAFDAILRDVNDQWTQKPPTMVTLKAGQRSRTVSIPMSLDGVVRVTATGSRHSRLKVSASLGGRTLGTANGRRQATLKTGVTCRHAPVENLEVTVSRTGDVSRAAKVRVRYPA